MPTMEELLNSKDQSLSSFSPSSGEEESFIDESSLTPEEMTAAAALGISTKRLSKKAYKKLKDKAEQIVKQTSVPSKTAEEAAKGIVKGGGKKSAEVSARVFKEALEKGPIKVPSGPVISDLPQVSGKMGAAMDKAARAAVGTAGEGVISNLPVNKATIAKSNLLSRIKAAAGSSRGKAALGKMLMAGGALAAASLFGEEEQAEEQDDAKKVITGLDDYEDMSTLKNPPKQTSSSLYQDDTPRAIRESAEKQPYNPLYLKAYVDETKARDAFFKHLQTTNLAPEEKARQWEDFQKRNSNEKIQERAAEKMYELEEEKSDLVGQKKELEEKLKSEENIFTQQSLTERLAGINKRLQSYEDPFDLEGQFRAVATPAAKPQLTASSAEEFISQLPPAPVGAMAAPSVAPSAELKKPALAPAKKTSAIGEPTTAEVKKQSREEELTKIIGAQAAKEVAENEDLMSRFKEAQERERQAKLLIGLTRASQRVGAAIAGVKPGDMSFYEQAAKDAGSITEQVKEEYALASEAEKRDPNSAISKSYQDIVKSIGIPIKGNESAETLAKVLPYLQQYQSQKENREARKDELQIRFAEIANRKDESRSDKQDRFIQALRKETTSGALGKMFSNYNTAQRMSLALEKFAKDPTGYSDYATLMGGLKALQGDESVVRESEIRLGMNATSLANKIKNWSDRLISGQSLQPEQRDQMVKAVKILAETARNQYSDAISPIMRQAENIGIDKKMLVNQGFLESGESAKPQSATSTKPGYKGPIVRQNGIEYKWNEQLGKYE